MSSTSLVFAQVVPTAVPPPIALAVVDDLEPTIPVVNSPAIDVYPGCDVPSYARRGEWWVDPINGDDASGDGGATKPWKTLQTVMTTKVSNNHYVQPVLLVPKGYAPTTPANGLKTYPVNPTGPIQAGDTIWLMNGNHGIIKVGSGLNSDFVYVRAARGQRPVVENLYMGAVSHWLFQGIKFQNPPSGGTNPPAGKFTVGTIYVAGGWFNGPADNVIFDGNLILGPSNVAGLTQEQWHAQGRTGIGIRAGGNTMLTHCFAVTNNKIWHVSFGIQVGAVDVLVRGNTINQITADFVDYGGINLIIDNNRWTNSNFLNDGIHLDCAQHQGWDGAGSNDVQRSSRHIVISNNLCQRRTGPLSSYFPLYGTQGIDSFDYDISDVIVTGNTIISHTWHAISFASIHNGLIANNTVLDDGDPALVAYPSRPWIKISPTSPEGGLPSSNVRITKNLAAQIIGFSVARDATITADHNIVWDTFGFTSATDVMTYGHRMGTTYGDSNRYIANFPAKNFVRYDPPNFNFDLRLLPNSVAYGVPIAASSSRIGAH